MLKRKPERGYCATWKFSVYEGESFGNIYHTSLFFASSFWSIIITVYRSIGIDPYLLKHCCKLPITGFDQLILIHDIVKFFRY